MSRSADSIWTAAQQVLRDVLKTQFFDLWFAPLRARGIQEGILCLQSRDDFSAAWLVDNYGDLLRSAVVRAAGEPLGVIVEAPPHIPGSPDLADGISPLATLANGDGGIHALDSDTAPGGSAVGEDTRGLGGVSKPGETVFNTLNTFETFVVGSGNDLAHGAALAVANSPGRTYNPLFLCGGVGLGKTHLLHAIGHHVAAHRKGARVAYLSCEKFTNEFINGLQNNQLARFRKKYRQVDLLLIDDVQFLADKERIQEEFFHTFNALHENRKQLVLSCDRPASEIKGLEQRLVSRFEWGLMADLQAPDIETRLAILRKKEKLMRVELPDDVRNFIAQRIRTNVRRLEGAYLRVTSVAMLNRKPPTVDSVEIILRDILQEEGRQTITIDVIQRRVAEHFDIRLADMTSKRRPEAIAFPRQVAMYLARQLTDCSLSAIGDAFGGRDHGTVLHACRAVKDRMETDSNARQSIARLERLLTR